MLAFSCCIACAPDAERTQNLPPVGEEVEVIQGLMAAFNGHDADAMRTYWHDDVTWIEVAGEQSSIVTRDADTLLRETKSYFEAFPSVQSSLVKIAVNGNYVSAIERPVWEENGERKSQASIVIYEVIDAKVKRFWYFPPQ